jgi:hypothetical protein
MAAVKALAPAKKLLKTVERLCKEFVDKPGSAPLEFDGKVWGPKTHSVDKLIIQSQADFWDLGDRNNWDRDKIFDELNREGKLGTREETRYMWRRK